MTCNPQANDKNNLWNVEGNSHDNCECVIVGVCEYVMVLVCGVCECSV